ncbi:glycosyltransferase family 2 protein [Chitiniphilus purpureus]|uniref:Glycosyltransferase family 2 protein n=1 Tax=Chitiniphilus purpureus TaxID=2981137 RepID=A0ABY6DPD4_9NEIS|nr:glycosyltransferase family A protein [Chitiniphilus sp. CD1]UXY15548.1 glycosyltransferase family 2 protein [Chitiniphilus sp. CD1]
MKVELLIATMHSKAAQNAGLFATPAVDFLVIDQLPQPGHRYPADARVLDMQQTGLSRSRNCALEHTRGDIAVLADDDIHHAPRLAAALGDAYAATGADFITFNNGASRPDGGGALKAHTRRSVLQVSSCLISLRPQAFRQAGLRFDERFGLGADFPSGEENILLFEALGRGLKGWHLDLPLVFHEAVSTGYRFTPALAESKGALQLRLFGPAGYLSMLAFAWKKRAQYRDRMGFLDFVAAELRGARRYRQG